jgi:hypothetical protein
MGVKGGGPTGWVVTESTRMPARVGLVSQAGLDSFGAFLGTMHSLGR